MQKPVKTREHLETLEQTQEAEDKGGRDMGVAEESLLRGDDLSDIVPHTRSVFR